MYSSKARVFKGGDSRVFNISMAITSYMAFIFPVHSVMAMKYETQMMSSMKKSRTRSNGLAITKMSSHYF